MKSPSVSLLAIAMAALLAGTAAGIGIALRHRSLAGLILAVAGLMLALAEAVFLLWIIAAMYSF